MSSMDLDLLLATAIKTQNAVERKKHNQSIDERQQELIDLAERAKENSTWKRVANVQHIEEITCKGCGSDISILGGIYIISQHRLYSTQRKLVRDDSSKVIENFKITKQQVDNCIACTEIDVQELPEEYESLFDSINPIT